MKLFQQPISLCRTTIPRNIAYVGTTITTLRFHQNDNRSKNQQSVTLERQSISPERQSLEKPTLEGQSARTTIARKIDVRTRQSLEESTIDFTRTTMAQKINNPLCFGFLSHFAFNLKASLPLLQNCVTINIASIHYVEGMLCTPHLIGVLGQ